MPGKEPYNPFVGPRPIQKGEALYGRDKEIVALYNRLQARRIVVLHAPSGAGKSSLVQAGLLPALQKGGFEVWKPIRVNLDSRDIEGVPPNTNRYLLSAMLSLEAEVLPPEKRRSPAQLAGMDFLAYLESRPRQDARTGKPIVLVFDQFEEVLTVGPRAIVDKQTFFEAVGSALATENYWALFVLREDHLAAFAPYRDRLPTHMSHTFRLDLLGRDGAKDAAVKLALGGVPSRAFPAVDKLIHDLSMVQTQGHDGQTVLEEGLYVEPVYLQVVGRQLWAKMPADDAEISIKDIEDYAEVSTVLAGYYAHAVENVVPGDLAVERAVRDWVRGKLIVGGIRSQVRREPTHSAGLDNALIEKLVNSYLLRTEERAGGIWFELSHDRMVKPIILNNEEWEQSHLHSSQVQARLWEAQGRARDLLLAAEALPAAEESRRKHEALWTKVETEFLSESRRVRNEERRWRRQLRGAAVVLGVALIAAVVAGFVARRQSLEAHDAKLASYQEQGRMAAIDGKADAALAYLSEIYRDGYRDPKRSTWIARFLLGGLSRHLAFPLLRGVDKDLTTMIISADGARILTTSADGPPQVWDARTGRKLSTLEGHTKSVNAVALSPDGQTVATAGADGSVKLFHADDGRAISVLETGAELVHAVAFSNDGKLVAMGSADGSLRVRDVSTGHQLAVNKGDHLPISTLAFSKDAKVLAVGDEVGTVRLVDPHTGEATDRFEISGYALRTLAFSPNGKILAAGGDDWHAHLLKLPSGEEHELCDHMGPIRALAFSPDGTTIATASDDGTARLWPTTLGREPVRSPERPEAPDISKRLDGHTGAVLAVAFVRDSETGARTVATAGADGSTRVWLLDRLRAQLEDQRGPVRGAEFSADGKSLATVSEDGNIFLYPANGARTSKRLNGTPGKKLYRMAVAPDGQTIAAIGEDSTALLWRSEGGDAFAKLEGHAKRIRAIAFSPDGKTIATSSEDGTARVWPANGGAALAVLDAHKGELRSVKFSPDGRLVATADIDGVARIWSAAGGAPLAVLTGHKDRILSLAFSRDGTMVATASADGTGRIWQSKDGQVLAELKGHRGAVGTIVFSPDDKTIATAGADGTGGLWKVPTGKLLARLAGHTDTVNGIAFSPNGQLVATASSDRTARIWDLSGRPLARLSGHWDWVWSVAFSPNGDTLATSSEDGTARLWDLRPEERPATEIDRRLRCRVPWEMHQGTLAPTTPDPTQCEDATAR